MNTTQPQQKPSAFSSFRRRIVATYIILLCAGFAACSHYRHPLVVFATILINFIIRHGISPVFPRMSDRANFVLLINVILFGIIVFTFEPPLRDVLLAVSFTPVVCVGLYSDYRLWRTESQAARNA